MTGFVRIHLATGGETRFVKASSFGQAASQVNCDPGEIIYFEWAHGPGRPQNAEPQHSGNVLISPDSEFDVVTQ